MRDNIMNAAWFAGITCAIIGITFDIYYLGGAALCGLFLFLMNY